MRSRGSKSFRFLQIISAANKQYAGARAPDRQQNQLLPLVFRFAAFAVFYAAACIPLVFRFAAFAVFYAAAVFRLYFASPLSHRLLFIVISQQFAAILVLFIGRRYYLRPIGRLGCLALLLR